MSAPGRLRTNFAFFSERFTIETGAADSAETGVGAAVANPSAPKAAIAPPMRTRRRPLDRLNWGRKSRRLFFIDMGPFRMGRSNLTERSTPAEHMVVRRNCQRQNRRGEQNTNTLSAIRDFSRRRARHHPTSSPSCLVSRFANRLFSLRPRSSCSGQIGALTQSTHTARRHQRPTS